MIVTHHPSRVTNCSSSFLAYRAHYPTSPTRPASSYNRSPSNHVTSPFITLLRRLQRTGMGILFCAPCTTVIDVGDMQSWLPTARRQLFFPTPCHPTDDAYQRHGAGRVFESEGGPAQNKTIQQSTTWKFVNHRKFVVSGHYRWLCA